MPNPAPIRESTSLSFPRHWGSPGAVDANDFQWRSRASVDSSTTSSGVSSDIDRAASVPNKHQRASGRRGSARRSFQPRIDRVECGGPEEGRRAAANMLRQSVPERHSVGSNPFDEGPPPYSPFMQDAPSAMLVRAAPGVTGALAPDGRDVAPCAPPNDLDPVHENWAALQENWNAVKGSPQADMTRSVDKLYEALMSHPARTSASEAAMAKALVDVVKCTATTDYAALLRTLFDGTLTPNLNDGDLEAPRALARLQDPADAGRQAIIKHVGKLLASSRWFQKKRNPNAPQSLQNAGALVGGLLDAVGRKCHDIVAQQEWRESIPQAMSAVDDMLHLPGSQHEAAGARLVRALRRMRSASDTLDFTQSVEERFGALIHGLPAGTRKQLDGLRNAVTAQGTDTAADAAAHAERLNLFIENELPKYEPDERMREKLHIFWKRLCKGTARPSPLANEQGMPIVESGYQRSRTAVRWLSRLYQWLRGQNKTEPLHTHNAIKDLVDGLVGNKTLSEEKLSKKRILLNLSFATDPDAALGADEARAKREDRAAALAYLHRTLRKLTPPELQTLQTVLTGPQESTRDLESSPALYAALAQGLTQEMHIRDLQRCAQKIQGALNLGRIGKASAKRRGHALIAAMDDYYATAARVPDDQSAVALMTLAIQRQIDRQSIRRVALQDWRRVASAVDDMNAALGHKSDDGKRCRRYLLDVWAYAAHQA